MRGRGPEQQRGDGAADRVAGAGRHGQGVHRERGGQGRDRRAGRQGGTGPGPGGRADQQRGRHNRTHVPGRHRPHHRRHRQHQLAGTLLGECRPFYCPWKRSDGRKTGTATFSFQKKIFFFRNSEV